MRARYWPTGLTQVAVGLTCGFTLLQSAQAASPIISGTMSGKFDKSYQYVDDRPVLVFKPDAGSPVRHELLVFLHGCCSPASADKATASGNLDNDGFLSAATANGYHAISLDYHADDKHPAPGGRTNLRCACDPDCYGYYYAQLWRGKWRKGLPQMDPRESIEHRLVKVLKWLKANDPQHHWGQFLVEGEPGRPNYARIAMSGHSLGSNVAAYIGKHVKLARVVLLAGPGDTLDSDPQHGKPYCYQDLTNSECARKAKPPGWLTDNHFGSNGGTVWKTPLDKLYSIRGACDDVMLNGSLADAIPFDPHLESTLKAWDALALDTRGAYQQVGGPGPYQAHGLVLGRRDPSALPYKCLAASLCGGGHSSMLGGLSSGGGHCANAGDLATLRAAWKYVLTDP